MATLSYNTHFSVTINGQEYAYRTKDSTALTLTVNNPLKDETKTIAATTTWDAWTSGAEEFATTFELLMIAATAAIAIEITVDKDADVGEEVLALLWPANFPFILVGDDGKANYTKDFAAGTDDVVDRIRVRNESATALDCRLLMFG